MEVERTAGAARDEFRHGAARGGGMHDPVPPQSGAQNEPLDLPTEADDRVVIRCFRIESGPTMPGVDGNLGHEWEAVADSLGDVVEKTGIHSGGPAGFVLGIRVSDQIAAPDLAPDEHSRVEVDTHGDQIGGVTG